MSWGCSRSVFEMKAARMRGYDHRKVLTFGPEGRPKIAQRFIAGERQRQGSRPIGTVEPQPSLRDGGSITIRNPALKRWAIFDCPSGANPPDDRDLSPPRPPPRPSSS